MAIERVTVTLPSEIVEDIDRQERNRSRFVLEAVERELERRRRELLRRSLTNPHPEASELAEAGFEEWGAGVENAEDSALLDERQGARVRWTRGRGWARRPK